ncbi:MAG TPA: hypothetical protein ENF38_00295, partial [Candidatus Aenigmarchaeota archaeon]|nr:hypothetical protein [Candidatus Aenigmarchaeota archaeon]
MSILAFLSSSFLKSKTKKFAREVRDALLSLEFYRNKIRENKIPLSRVKEINDLNTLEKFLNEHPIEWVKPDDLVNDTYSSFLSKAPSSERLFPQSSSGYSVVEGRSIGRKKVMFTKRDIKKALEIYKRGMEVLYEKNERPVIGLLGHLNYPSGSGNYPNLGLLLLNFLHNKSIIFYSYGAPLTDEHLIGIARMMEEDKVNGVISTPSIVSRLLDIYKPKENLRFIAMGGFKPPKEVVEKSRETADIVIDGYSVQEVMPLTSIGNGIMSSKWKKLSETEGIVVNGLLCYVRVVDKDGQSVNEGEKGEIRVTTAFEGTSLIDYPTEDETKLLSKNSTYYWRGWKILTPFPLLDYCIKRTGKKDVYRIKEYSVNSTLLESVISDIISYDFHIKIDRREGRIEIFLPNDLKETIR